LNWTGEEAILTGCLQSGEWEATRQSSNRSFRSLLIIPRLPFQYIGSLSMEPRVAESTRVNGLVRQQRHSAFGMDTMLPFQGQWLTSNRALALQQATVSLAVYITGDGSDVYEDKVFEAAKGKTGSFQPTLLLVGTRLGLDRITPVYWEALKDTLQMPQSVGIAG
jgi:hypothetical protein